MDKVLARAADELRQETPAGWIDLSGNVLSRVWAATRHTWPVAADITDLADLADQSDRARRQDTVLLADRVIIDHLRRHLNAMPRCAAASIDLHLSGRTCEGVSIDVIAQYGTVLNDVANDVRATVVTILAELLGPHSPPGTSVEVHIRDVTSDDPRL